MINTSNKTIIGRLENSFNGQPWHGKSVMAILEMTDQPLPHRALALLNHMIAWRDFVTAALEDREYAIELNTEADWPPVTESQEVIKANLQRSQEVLLKAVQQFDPLRWKVKPKDVKYTYLQLCHGLIDHDIYHSGQIALEIRADQERSQ